MQRGGFASIELMVVASLVAMVLAFATGHAWHNGIREAKQHTARQSIRTFTAALGLYQFNAKRYPTTRQGLDALVARPSRGPRPAQWEPILQSVPLDPWGRPFRYLSPGIKNKHSFDLWSLGADGKPSADDITNWRSVER